MILTRAQFHRLRADNPVMNGALDTLACANECFAFFPGTTAEQQQQLADCLHNCYGDPYATGNGNGVQNNQGKNGNKVGWLLPIGLGIGLAILATTKR